MSYNARRVYEKYCGPIPKGKHIHHVIPLREGGTDNIKNLMCVTPEEHAKIHEIRGDKRVVAVILAGRGTGMSGKKHTKEAKKKMSENTKAPEHSGMLGKKHSEESKRKISNKMKNAPKYKCEHCSTITNKGNFIQWHGDNCRFKV